MDGDALQTVPARSQISVLTLILLFAEILGPFNVTVLNAESSVASYLPSLFSSAKIKIPSLIFVSSQTPVFRPSFLIRTPHSKTGVFMRTASVLAKRNALAICSERFTKRELETKSRILGKAIAAMIAIMATVTISSNRVNPCTLLSCGIVLTQIKDG